MIKRNETTTPPSVGAHAAYMRTWLMMKISAQNAPSVFGKRRLKKEWLGYAKEFGLDTYLNASDDEKEKLMAKWEGFLSDYCHLCLTDHTYGSTLFGMIRMKEDTVEEKLRNELETITALFPEHVGLKELFAPLHTLVEKKLQANTGDDPT